MTLSLGRFSAAACWLAVILAVVVANGPLRVAAQSPSIKARAVPPVKARSHTPWVPNSSVGTKDAYLIVDATSGRDLASDRPDELRHPASLTKLMTLYLTFAALDSGRLGLGDALPVSLNALNAPPTKMGMTGGMVVVRDAIMGLVTRSANDAAVVLGEALGGDEDSFARLMTQKARQLGMSSTVFRNASGLPNQEQVTTARDMTKLAYALLRDFPHYYPIFSVQSYLYRGRPLANHNQMLQSYPGADGLKTGYTVASGFNLVMSAVRDSRRLIGVVMGGDTAWSRDRLMAELMDQGFLLAQAQSMPAWNWPRPPQSARYTASSFVAGTTIVEAPHLAPPVAKAEPAPTLPPKPAVPVRLANAEPTAPVPSASTADPSTPAIGSWVIQVGSFSDSRAAQAALERANSMLPEVIRSHGALSIDEVQMAAKTFHRARVTNLSQDEAIDGCKKLEQRKVYCSAIQVTAWNTPGAR